LGYQSYESTFTKILGGFRLRIASLNMLGNGLQALAFQQAYVFNAVHFKGDQVVVVLV